MGQMCSDMKSANEMLKGSSGGRDYLRGVDICTESNLTGTLRIRL